MCLYPPSLHPVVSILLDVEEPALLIDNAPHDVLIHPRSHEHNQHAENTYELVTKCRHVYQHPQSTHFIRVHETPKLEQPAL